VKVDSYKKEAVVKPSSEHGCSKLEIKAFVRDFKTQLAHEAVRFSDLSVQSLKL
jgi:hypothetical protein